MAEKRIQFSNIVQNQLPAYTKTEFPLVSEFLKQYYLGQEFQGGSIDLIQNIDQYVKITEQTNLTEAVGLSTAVDQFTDVIPVDMVAYPAGTDGFPSSYGLLKIDNEIITYTGTATTCFTGCVRGFCGITSYKTANSPDVLEFNTSTSQEHPGGSKVENLSCLFLKEFLLKTKNQLLPGLENRKLHKDLNQDNFIKNAKDFYLSKGTDKSFEILFKALYNEDVRIIKPRDFLFTPSNANYRVTKDFVVESIEGEGNPVNLEQSTLFQDTYQYGNYTKAYAPITSVEPINTGDTGIGQTFYKLSIDAGYNRDVRVQGSIYGDFKTHSKTRVVGKVSAGTTYLDVDSTVGFPTSGELYVPYTDGSVGVVSYTSRNTTQFFDCSNINGTIADASNIGINTYVYGSSFVDSSKTIKVRINSVIEDFDFPDNTLDFGPGDTANIKTLGVSDGDFKGRNWFYNISPIYKIKKVTLIDSADWTYRIELNVDHCFRVGDLASISLLDDVRATSTVIKIDSSKSFECKGQGQLTEQPSNTYKVKRLTLKTESNNFPESSIYSTNVQNVYKRGEDYLVASSSIPSYNAQPLDVYGQTVTFSGTFIGSEFLINPLTEDHGFYTGDAIYLSPRRITEKYFDAFGNEASRVVDGTCIATEGLYFVYRINNSKIKLATSRTNISDETFVTLDDEITVEKNRIEPYDFRFKTLRSQDLVRQISLPEDDNETEVETEPGFTGILVNGVQVLNYKAGDVIKYGQINSIDVSSPGSAYDIINPPLVHIKDSVGSGATAYAAVEGSLSELRLLTPGFDYEETPTVTISGGNGKEARIEVNMKQITHSVDFFADANIHGGQTAAWVNLTDNTIGFNTYHKFRNAEKVIYKTNGQTPIGGITTDSQYYVYPVNNTTIKLYPKENDAFSGINTISLTSHGVGKQNFQAVNKKLVVDALNVIDGGSGYANQKRSTPTESGSGINTSINYVTIPNHDYQSGEIVQYTAEGTALGGLTSGSEYYVTKLNNSKFKLSKIGAGTTLKTHFYDTEQYIDFTSVGVGTHTFNYQPITVNITGKVGIASIAGDTFQCRVQPIIRGNITSIHVSKNGVGYGSSEIINFDRQPDVTLINGSGAQLKPVINDGAITEVLVQATGSQYNSPPDLVINGDGVGAVLTPVLVDNTLSSITVIEKGSGYTQANTSITVLVPGEGAEFRANIQNWRLNLFQRHIDNFSTDDGIIADQFNIDRGLQYSHLYAPRKLREAMFGTDQDGNVLYGQSDLQRVNSLEVASSDHSPIIGWAYDGNPIYGPYGYSTQTGGVVAQMQSGYSVDLKASRPPQNEFPVGFFIEDFTYTEVSDQKILDENNGRFCITPEYPNGTYAYFATIEEGNADSAGPFAGYKRPKFPYLVGNNFKSTPNKFNFSSYSNQDQYELNNSQWSRNTYFYNLIEGDLEYEYVYIPNDLKQTLDIKTGKPGRVDNLGITTAGDLYQVGDKVIFDNTGTQGNRASAKVSWVEGKALSNISVATSSVSGVEIYPGEQKGEYILWSTKPHQFKTLDLVNVSGLSTTSSKIGGDYKVGIASDIFTLVGLGTSSSGIGSDGVTGIVTYFDINGNLKYPHIRENDILTINSEKIQVLNVEPEFSRIRALRAVEGTAGAAHTVTTTLYENPRKLVINAGFNTTYNVKLNKQIYFIPNESVALGTASGVGIGTTIQFYSQPGYPSATGAGITQVFIPTKSIWIKNHGLETNDQLTYSPNRGAGLDVQNSGGGISTLTDGQTLYAYKQSDNLIGIATVRVGLNTAGDSIVGIASTYRSSSTLFFSGIGTGTWHSFKTNYTPITGEISRNLVTVSTGSSHGLESGDTVDINVSPGNISTTFTVKYNDYNRVIVVDPKDFVAGGVNTTTNAITVTNHGWETGQKIVHTASIPCGGLSNNGEYYVVKIDDNTVKLSNNYYNSTLLKPVIVGITSTSAGTINPVNPPLKVYQDQSAIFDISDSSLGYVSQGTNYPAFKFNVYSDKNLVKVWETDKVTDTFNITRSGDAGVDSDATVTLRVNKDIPETLFYTLDPLYEGSLPDVKEQIIQDSDVLSGNQIQIKDSVYNGKQTISVGATNSFTYCLNRLPEKASYISTTSVLSYQTDSASAFGGVAQFKIFDGGENYYSLPGITTITTGYGKNARIETSSKTVGAVGKTKINNIGYNFPSDNTLRPSVGLPQLVTIDKLAAIRSIGITSVGRGYAVAPQLKVFDGITRIRDKDIELKYTLGDPTVSILQPSKGISNVPPIIIPTENTNGVGINTVGFNTITKNVSITLATGFSTTGTFPFEVGDKVLVENISVGVGTTARGYNSAEYNYKLFELTEVDSNIGGLGIVTFSLYDYYSDLNPEVTPGQFDANTSSGRIIPEKYFPIFNVKLGINDYLTGETVKSDSATGIVEKWDPKLGLLKISSNQDFKVDDIIRGESSETAGIADSITSYDSNFKLGPYSEVNKGWETDSGVLNTNMQRIQDSLYYQNFSYSLRSKVSMNTWDDVVSTLNHTLGHVKFSDMQVDSLNENSMTVGLSTEVTSYDVVSHLIGIGNLNTVHDFDLVKENSLNCGSKIISNEIIFSNRVLFDYDESVGNRVLSIDDVASQFNSNPRPTPFSIAAEFDLDTARAVKYFVFVKDRRYIQQRQLQVVDLVHNNSDIYLQQYGRIESVYNLGSFDANILGTKGRLLWYPKDYKVNDYDITAISYHIDDDLLSVGSTSFGVTKIDSTSTNVATATTTGTTIVSIGVTYRSSKILVNIRGDNSVSSGGEFEFEEMNLIHDGTTVDVSEWGNLLTEVESTDDAGAGLGTYSAYIDGANVKIDWFPDQTHTGIGTTAVVNTIQVSMAATGSLGAQGTIDLKHGRFQSTPTGIASTSSPSVNVIGEYVTQASSTVDGYDAAYFVVQLTDTNQTGTSEIFEGLVIDDYRLDTDSGDSYETWYGQVGTSGIGTVGTRVVSDSNAGVATVQLLCTPTANIAVQADVYMNAIKVTDDDSDNMSFNNSSVQTEYGLYEGTENALKRAFMLTHKNERLFERSFEGDSSDIVSVADNTITIPNHFFVTGEKIKYVHEGSGSYGALGIASTDGFVGVGTTTLLPANSFVVKINADKIKLATTAQNSLLRTPEVLDITSVGIGTSHRFVATNQNAKVMVSLDNIIQSPVVASAVTTVLSQAITTTDDLIYLSGISSITGADLLQVNDEIMKVESVGVGSTNRFRVKRQWLGTNVAGHSTGALVTKVKGNYNITDNVLNFTEAPYGNTPLSSTTNPPDSRDWVGIATGSHFNGRMFMRSGIIDSSNETYYQNYVFGDISHQFNGSTKSFDLKQSGSDITGIATENAVILINDVFQGPGSRPNSNYALGERAGVTTITFTGTASSVASDVNLSTLPVGGVILSLGSTEGHGYQPLVAAGGTAVVSTAGTIQSVSIGYSGSGYRSGIGQTVNVGVGTTSLTTPNTQWVGTATIGSNGTLTGVAITISKGGYSQTDPPFVIIDSPLSYTNIPLEYSSDSPSAGVGTNATVDVVVGQGSSVIEFSINCSGSGYRETEILTIPYGGTTGIPTDTSTYYNEFQLTVDEQFSDKFSGWSLGELENLDDWDSKFDGDTVTFPLARDGELISIRTSRGSKIDIEEVLLIFINDILQVPNKGYKFDGGSQVVLTEAPKVGDISKVIFYKGSGSVDVVSKEILETVKKGDDLRIENGSEPFYLSETTRGVSTVTTTSAVNTVPYFGPGNTQNENLERPVVWTRQTEDKIIGEELVGKDRELYEANVFPSAYLTKTVGIGSTVFFVDSVRPFFDPDNEMVDDTNRDLRQDNVTIISQDSRIGAIGTCLVTTSGIVTSVDVTDGGSGYTSAPSVIFGNTGLGTTAVGRSFINAVGVVTGIEITNSGTDYLQTDPPSCLIAPPLAVLESDTVASYVGDSGHIVGFGTEGGAADVDKSLIFDIHIPYDSWLRNTSLVGTAITLSSINVGDYFVIKKTYVGFADTSLKSLDIAGETIGIGTDFVDNIYQVDTVANHITGALTGIGTTTFRRITAKIAGISTITFASTKAGFSSVTYDFSSAGQGAGSGWSGAFTTSYYLGDFSWGKVNIASRGESNEYPAYTDNGVPGISTGSIVRRTKALKAKHYDGQII